MIYGYMLTENARKDTNILDNSLRIFYEHIIKFISRRDVQSIHWIGSIKSSIDNILKVKKDSPSVYKNYSIDFDTIYNDIIGNILKENKGKTKDDFNHSLVFSTFNDLDTITNIDFLRQFLISYIGNNNYEDFKRRIMNIGS